MREVYSSVLTNNLSYTFLITSTFYTLISWNISNCVTSHVIDLKGARGTSLGQSRTRAVCKKRRLKVVAMKRQCE